MKGHEFMSNEVLQVSYTEPLGFGNGKIHSDVKSDTEADKIRNQIPYYMTEVDPNLPTACIDGRPVKSLLNGDESQPRYGVAGGAGVTGYAAAELTHWFGDSDDTPRERYRRITTALEIHTEGQLNIVVGGHVDDHSVESDFKNGTGCGAADKLESIIDTLALNPEFCRSVAQVVLGDAYNQEIADSVVSQAQKISKERQLAEWSGKLMIEDFVDERVAGERIEVLESDDTETHFHKEDGLLVNYTEGQTFDRDAFYLATGKQLFDVDIPMVNRIAQKLAGGPQAHVQAERLLHAAVLYHTATYATLCDGSQRAYILE